jgi:D-3-phosphoglycerate dehydrogenase
MNVLFLDSVHDELQHMLSKAGYDCEHDYSSHKNEILNKLHRVNGLVIRSRIPIDRELLNAAPNLKFIARAGAGLENIDLDEAAKLQIKVFSVPEANRDAVGEHALGMLLMLLNHLKRADAEVRNGIWRRAENRGTELKNKIVGIIGFGQMGSAFAEKLSGLGCRILAYDKYHQLMPASIKAVSLSDIQSQCDVISFHVPLTKETHYYLNDEFLENCKKEVVIINTARGKIIDSAALVRGLKSEKVLGACLDVLEYEGKSFESLELEKTPETLKFLLESEKVLLSPHIAGWTHESHFKLSRLLGEKILQYFQPPNGN